MDSTVDHDKQQLQMRSNSSQPAQIPIWTHTVCTLQQWPPIAVTQSSRLSLPFLARGRRRENLLLISCRDCLNQHFPQQMPIQTLSAAHPWCFLPCSPSCRDKMQQVQRQLPHQQQQQQRQQQRKCPLPSCRQVWLNSF